MLDFAGKRWWYLGFSGVFFLAALAALAIFGLKPGIEFTSGSTFTIEFKERTVTQAELRQAMRDLGHPEARVQQSGTNTFIVRTNELENAPSLTGGAGPVPPGEIDDIERALQERFGALERKDFATVSGSVSAEIARYATLAVIAAAVAILVYIWLAFRQLPKAWRYGACAVIALVHDAVIVMGLFAVLGEFRGVEVDTAFITAILTVIGFSVHDTIVVFDRVREVVSQDPYVPFEEAVNASLTETLARSINTSVTVLLTIVAMLLIGGETIRNFLLVLLVGIVAGTYSSIGVASQVLVAWENGDLAKLWRKVRGQQKLAAEAA
ncbi:protein translocase subunit SecF [Tepidiforma thermophila]|uniref:Protein-export membrane protein SecF n=1 Tax=Tepidiforma thermophila (strain KCTC 52669 / CGMCC 1.13589 / G233) TaxID=2761530 RepID=A0A2A9HG55_TEPT2|nr:protein translocase subunit SecF [Tepidiforma thermophila]PFG73956.1 protein translocase subunit secF [Tepidiforma thermophila]